jgi:glycosyltransferase involved in cell wall biosynthesis
MKIAFCNRPTWNNPLGGDGIQMLKTKVNIEKRYGAEVQILTHPDDLNSSFDIAHIFNYATYEETESFFIKAQILNLKIVSSSIFWDYRYAITPLLFRAGIYCSFISEEFLKRSIFINTVMSKLTGKPILLSKRFRQSLKYFIQHSDVILPNSQEEGEMLLNYAGVTDSFNGKIHIVYNGVELKNTAILPKKIFFEKYGIPEDYVLQVSRIQYLKNQLNLLYSLMDKKEIPLVFVGKVIEKGYFNQLKRMAAKRGNVYFLSEVSHEDIYSFYFYAKTHVLLSFRESPGLVSLEALSQGCPIVVADKRFAPVDTYFDEQVEIVNPLNPQNIRDGIIRSLQKERKKINISSFSWEKAAEQTYEAYLQILK